MSLFLISMSETPHETKVKHLGQNEDFLGVDHASVSLFHPLESETVKQIAKTLIQYGFEGVSPSVPLTPFLKHSHSNPVTETSNETKVKHLNQNEDFLEIDHALVSLFHPLESETVKQIAKTLIQYGFEGVSPSVPLTPFLKHSHSNPVTETPSETKVKHLNQNEVSE